MSLRQAYLEVQARHLAADQATVRQSVMKELEQAPRATAVSRPGAERLGQPPGTRSSVDIARDVLARLERDHP
jgi:type IV secretory pathway TrbL component